MKTLSAIFLAAALAVFGSRASARPEAVSMNYQLDNAHSGAMKMKGFSAPLRLAWKTDLTAVAGGTDDFEGTSYPIIVNGKVYVTVDLTSYSGTYLIALDLKTGKILWNHQIPGTHNFSAAAYDNGRVFVINPDGLLQAFDADKGNRLWTHQFAGVVPDFGSGLVAEDGQIYVGGNVNEAGHIYSVDETTGNETWWKFTDDGGGDRTIPALGDKGLFVSYSCNYYKFNPLTGASLWEKHLGCYGGGGMTPVLSGKRYYVRDTEGGLGDLVLDSKTGNSSGTFQSDNPPAFWTGKKNGEGLALTTSDYVIHATDLKTGREVWSFAGEGYLEMTPIVINDDVVAASLFGTVYVLDVATGRVKWSQYTGSAIYGPLEHWLVPMTGFGAGDGTLIVPATDFLAAFVPAAGPDGSPAPPRPRPAH